MFFHSYNTTGNDPYNTNESEDIEGIAPPLDEVSLGG